MRKAINNFFAWANSYGNNEDSVNEDNQNMCYISCLGLLKSVIIVVNFCLFLVFVKFCS